MATYDLSGRTALVTGAAGSGIGQATARRLLAEGTNVVVTDVHEGRLAAVADELGAAYGDAVLALLMDAGDRAQIDAGLAQARERFGLIDVLVNNAAVNALAPVGEMDPGQWDWAIGVNLSGPWYLCRAVLGPMVEVGRGSIVNITSVAGYIQGTNEGPYAGAKAALHQLTRTIATEYGPQGIRCNGVAPGIIHTWFVDANAHHNFSTRPPKHPGAGDWGLPDDIANVVAWLVSDESELRHRRDDQRQRRLVHASVSVAREPEVLDRALVSQAGWAPGWPRATSQAAVVSMAVSGSSASAIVRNSARAPSASNATSR